ncbi:hypothetical protein HHK36_009411 [Tetracentron sinense]|uniref:Uncharacterized protein n=1 Tax=Tetracentron sinense TaxID=13715 RepID=A0A834ZIW1_TETSI|nr:hypothetical protein HHK36_009411 [Tetracentron sinense]
MQRTPPFVQRHKRCLRLLIVTWPWVGATYRRWMRQEGKDLFLPAAVRPILDSLETLKQVPHPALCDLIQVNQKHLCGLNYLKLSSSLSSYLSTIQSNFPTTQRDVPPENIDFCSMHSSSRNSARRVTLRLDTLFLGYYQHRDPPYEQFDMISVINSDVM